MVSLDEMLDLKIKYIINKALSKLIKTHSLFIFNET
jgi:hypothetical protein